LTITCDLHFDLRNPASCMEERFGLINSEEKMNIMMISEKVHYRTGVDIEISDVFT
jgi:hypothetical protein